MENELIAFLKEKYGLDELKLKIMLESFTEKKFQKNEIIVREGDIVDEIYLMKKGLVRMFVLNNEDDKSYRFFMNQSFFTVLPSFIQKTPSLYYLQALTDCEVLVIKRDKMYGIFDDYPIIERIYRLQIEKYFIELSNHLYSLHMHNATQRYAYFLEKNKELAKNLPIKYISTYLGIHPNSLSRIRKNTMKNLSISKDAD